MNNSPFLEELAKALKTKSEDIKIKQELVGTSSAKVVRIQWGKEKKEGILKTNTTKVEWGFYSIIAKNYSVPAPSPIAVSKKTEVPWVLLEQISRGVHPKKWEAEHVERSFRTLAKFHATFLGKEAEEEFDFIPKTFSNNWEETIQKLLSNINKASKLTVNYEGKTPLTKNELDLIKEKIQSDKFHPNIITAGISLIHGDTWAYNFMQSKRCNCLLDWQECNFAPPAVEFLHFYDLLPFHIEGIKISLKERPFSLEDSKKIYLNEFRKYNKSLNVRDFNKSLKEAIYFQLAHHWAPLLKPDVIYLHGGRYFVHRTLRLLPSRKEMSDHFQELLNFAK